MLLLGISKTLETAFSTPEFGLDQSEAHQLAKAYADVAQYYPVLAIDPRYAAIANLAGCVSIIGGSRIAAYRMRVALEKKAQPRERQPVQVAPIPPQDTGNSAPPERTTPVPKGAEIGEIPGVGNIQFPPDHPLMGGRKH